MVTRPRARQMAVFLASHPEQWPILHLCTQDSVAWLTVPADGRAAWESTKGLRSLGGDITNSQPVMWIKGRPHGPPGGSPPFRPHRVVHRFTERT